MPRTLLLADDSVTIQKVVGLSFANEDIRLVAVDNGDDAIVRAREVRPDIVLADVVMPGKNGYEVCEAIKNDPALSHVPVLLLTGTFEAFDEERARRARADGHITKPFEAQALVEQVNRLLAAAREAVSPNEVTSMAVAPAESDFFDEELAEPALESDATDGAPAFELGEGDEDLSFSLPEEEEHGASTDATVAMLDDDGDEDWVTGPETDPLLGGSDLGGFDLGEPVPGSQPGREGERILEPETDLASPTASRAPMPAAPAAPTALDDLTPASGPASDEDEPFEFGFDDEPAAAPRGSGDDPLARLDAEDLAREAVLDPEGGRSYDVSWSDLGDPVTPSRPAAATPAAAPGAPPRGPSSFTTPPAPAPFAAPPPSKAVTAPSLPPAPPAAPAAPAAPPVAAPAPTPAQRSAPSRAVPAAAPDLTPVLRERLHDTLEKIAWEAFSDLSDTIVRQVVERVEAVAWEVIPQMAEALIREEIRRLKAEPE